MSGGKSATPFAAIFSWNLWPPSGRSATLHNRPGGVKDDVRTTYEVSSAPALVGLLGETIRGNWMLRGKGLEAINTGKLEKWTLALGY